MEASHTWVGIISSHEGQGIHGVLGYAFGKKFVDTKVQSGPEKQKKDKKRDKREIVNIEDVPDDLTVLPAVTKPHPPINFTEGGPIDFKHNHPISFTEGGPVDFKRNHPISFQPLIVSQLKDLTLEPVPEEAKKKKSNGRKSTYDYSGRQDEIFCDGIRSSNVPGVPDWMRENPKDQEGLTALLQKLADSIQKSGKRKDAQLARNLVGSLPRNLTYEENTYVIQNIGDRLNDFGIVFAYAGHKPPVEGNGKNVHFHAIYTDREANNKDFRIIDGDGNVHSLTLEIALNAIEMRKIMEGVNFSPLPDVEKKKKEIFGDDFAPKRARNKKRHATTIQNLWYRAQEQGERKSDQGKWFVERLKEEGYTLAKGDEVWGRKIRSLNSKNFLLGLRSIVAEECTKKLLYIAKKSREKAAEDGRDLGEAKALLERAELLEADAQKWRNGHKSLALRKQEAEAAGDMELAEKLNRAPTKPDGPIRTAKKRKKQKDLKKTKAEVTLPGKDQKGRIKRKLKAEIRTAAARALKPSILPGLETLEPAKRSLKSQVPGSSAEPIPNSFINWMDVPQTSQVMTAYLTRPDEAFCHGVVARRVDDAPDRTRKISDDHTDIIKGLVSEITKPDGRKFARYGRSFEASLPFGLTEVESTLLMKNIGEGLNSLGMVFAYAGYRPSVGVSNENMRFHGTVIMHDPVSEENLARAQDVVLEKYTKMLARVVKKSREDAAKDGVGAEEKEKLLARAELLEIEARKWVGEHKETSAASDKPIIPRKASESKTGGKKHKLH